ncbi:penicillin-binding protein activator LpoB [Citrobacter sp. JGM124]|uniref:penicillin-binding protein activator LpoB n=1 Tax=Citrobacter sp. JGM124 TaxID=2799789 RepID=UPI001BA90E4E|nr:penicillin-binding protein activator LpoB [Citrobacter sp. JGM124]
MIGRYRYLTVAVMALVLSGCLSTQPPAPVDETHPTVEQPPVTPPPTVPPLPDISTGPEAEPTIPAVPRVRTYAWSSAVNPLISKMLLTDGVTAGGVLLVDSVNNQTNGSLNANSATEALVDALSHNRTFVLVSAQQLAVAKQQLGLSPQDSLGSRSKAIGIARNVGAQFVLYSNLSGNVTTPTLKMQLMLVQTGEIIWSGQSVVQQTD